MPPIVKIDKQGDLKFGTLKCRLHKKTVLMRLGERHGIMGKRTKKELCRDIRKIYFQNKNMNNITLRPIRELKFTPTKRTPVVHRPGFTGATVRRTKPRKTAGTMSVSRKKSTPKKKKPLSPPRMSPPRMSPKKPDSPYKSPAAKKLAKKIEMTRNMAINKVMQMRALTDANKKKLVKNLNTTRWGKPSKVP